MIRPEFLALLRRSSELLTATAIFAAGLWMISNGGYLLTPLGTVIAGIGLAWAILAQRRLRFAQATGSPGVVEVDEAQIGYMGPNSGGFVAIPDLSEIRLLTLQGRRVWRLKQSDGQALLIPVDATGAEALFDAFASLPGMNTNTLVAALDATPSTDSAALSLTATTQTIWHRKEAAVLAGQ